MTAHKHAALMLQYAEDAAKTDKPWELWERKNSNGEWLNLLCNPNWLEDHEYRHKPVKWNPVGGDWLVNISGESFEITSSKHSKELAIERPTKEQAERAAVEMRKFNRLLALRDELCGDLNAHNYEIIFDIVNEKWCISKVNCYKTVSAGFTTYDTAQRACDMLNNGEVEL